MNKVTNILTSKKVAAGLLMATAVGSSSAFAADTPPLGIAAFTQVGSLVTSYEAAAWPIVISLTVAVIGISLFKKFSKKAAS
ncbi:hypothetical protein C0W59_07660 [Photobacterium kishitanii]|uniref:major coat protein n=1 Tax=Photobacterium kishitanii TaxID=318456 RepID=UPI000D173723|nr:major coat protein [Photobacterium kishitanii]PSV16555.1 hypothetical protein C0W59_07660 [Photobacterium kishitanii]